MEHEGNSDTNSNWCTWNNPQRIGKKTGTTALRSARILGRVEETCCHSNSSEKPSANANVKNSQRSKIIRRKKSIQENETPKIAWHLEIQMGHLIQAKKARHSFN